MAINVTHLRSFYHVARLGSFTQAAKALGVSQPTLTRQLLTLEGDFDVKLLRRSTRKLELTEEGRRLLEICEPIFAGLEEAESYLRTEHEKLVRVDSVYTSRMTDFLAFGHRNFKSCRFDVRMRRSNEVYRSLLDGDCDIGMLTLPQDSTEFDHFTVGTYPLIALVGNDHPWRSRKTVSVFELVGQPVVATSHLSQSRHALDRALQSRNLNIDIVQVLDSNEVILDVIRNSASVGLMGYTGLIERGVDHYVTFDEPDMSVALHFACSHTGSSRGVTRAIFNLWKRELRAGAHPALPSAVR
ncbi:LysR family transcriptional regulator (plasmid) [Devosia neptuniae]|uniref:LysR family transcriptional regulator n=1 Tax=Devosia neptuniae TaxID=191302 RepID=A0ABY6C6T6_9HYPH|nr:LysR family transcriptional regulator [Devosia neptuniae]UXN67968.1 LysR family transcriptional regulator [Devosia neptuniae]